MKKSLIRRLNRRISKQSIRKDQHGFTLVELIVVLVILAILGAILTPALIGWIDKAREKSEMSRAETLRDVAQTELIELYGKASGLEEDDTIIPPSTTKKNNNGDTDVTKSDFAKNILKLAEWDLNNPPYLFLIAVGSNKKTTGVTNNASMHDKYTIFYACYMESAQSKPLYFYNGAWTRDNPRNTEDYDGKNIIQTGNRKNLRLQYYLIANRTGRNMYDNYGDDTKNLWSYIKGFK